MKKDKRSGDIKTPCAFDSHPNLQPACPCGQEGRGVTGPVLAWLQPCSVPHSKKPVTLMYRPPLCPQASPLPLKDVAYYQNTLHLGAVSDNCFHLFALTEICVSLEGITTLNII